MNLLTESITHSLSLLHGASNPTVSWNLGVKLLYQKWHQTEVWVLLIHRHQGIRMIGYILCRHQMSVVKKASN